MSDAGEFVVPANDVTGTAMLVGRGATAWRLLAASAEGAEPGILRG